MQLSRESGMAMLIFFVLFAEFVIASVSGEEPYFHVNLKDDDTITPESKSDFTADPSVKRIESTRLQYVEIGTWTLPKLRMDIYFSIDRVNLWYALDQQGIQSYPMAKYELIVDGDVVQENEGSLEDPGNEKPSEAEFTLGDELFDFPANATVQIRYYYRGQEPLLFYYDNSTYDTGFHGRTNFIHIWNLSAVGTELQLEVFDVFGSDWAGVSKYFELTADGETIELDSVETTEGLNHDINGSSITSTNITWRTKTPFAGGENIEVWVKYTHAHPDENKGHRIHATAEAVPVVVPSPDPFDNAISHGNEDSSSWEFFSATEFIVVGGIATLAGGGAFHRRRHR